MRTRFFAPSLATALVGLSFVALFLPDASRAQAPPPPDTPDVIEPSKLFPLFPEPPSGWTADKPEGATSDLGGFKLTNAHRDYKKGDGDNVPTASITILDAAANADYASATTAGWKDSAETAEGYAKTITVDGNPGFEAFETDRKHGSLWVFVAKRYFVQVELNGLDPKQLQEWIKRVDLKKIAEVK